MKPSQTSPEVPARGRLTRIVMKSGVLLCLLAIVFGLIVMLAGAMLTEGEGDVPELFAWMGAGACGLFTLGALLGLGAWLVLALSED